MWLARHRQSVSNAMPNDELCPEAAISEMTLSLIERPHAASTLREGLTRPERGTPMAKAAKRPQRASASRKRATTVDWAAVRSRLELIAVTLEVPSAEVEAALKSDRALIDFTYRYHQSLDWVILGDLVPMIRRRHRAGVHPEKATH
jgi:hypothetical protein